ncbi:hypothetical protein K503DRAFT_864296 [Rhizopogon vinicolor AM-OR11-026]|uniref:Uncharacterized protein n=1 Tax=Rhizopogon vinicolor AM-OR11-026 TaxID=1314800 RepID=A0A1B7N7R5_9AGAM|nr:hypothetical protein K503DRAFT_864296 [Rhizopogon vinicolor AM-OR11-026]
MDAWKVFLRAVTVVLSSIGIVLSLLAIFIRTLMPPYAKASAMLSKSLPPTAGVPRGRIAHPLQRSHSVPALASYPHSDISKNIMRNSIVDEGVPHVHSPELVTESRTHRSNRIEVSTEIHQVLRGLPVLISPSIKIVSGASKQPPALLRGKSSVGSLLMFFTPEATLCPRKNPSDPSDPPLRTQPYAAPYFFPAPGTPEAVDYVKKTRAELLRPRRTLRRFTQED